MNFISLTFITEDHFYLSSEFIISICAIVVSIVGLWISFRYSRKTLKMTEAHNKKIIRPSLTFHRYFALDDPKFSCEISNSGLGPAIIRKVEFYYKNEIFTNLNKLLNEKISDYSNLVISEGSLVSTFDDGEVLAVGAVQNIYKTKLKNINIVNQMKTILKETKIRVDYESIYGETLILNHAVSNSH